MGSINPALTDAAKAAADGSEARPIASIFESLAAAADLELCGVDLQVASGAYGQALDITRHTRILGPAGAHSPSNTAFINNSISNNGSTIESPTFVVPSPSDPEPVE